MVTCEIYFFGNSFHKFRCFVSHVTASEIISILGLFQPLELFQNYFSDIEHAGKYSRASEIISGQNYFRRTSTKAEIMILFRM